MPPFDLPFRQVHLDFHTSEHIADVGSEFDPEAFAETLHHARVNSVTCFARCHHGWLYYDSPLFPKRVHPKLVRRNLLREQMSACQRRGIRVPIYITVQWDHYTSLRHPEWCVLTREGRLDGTPPYEPGFYRTLCVNSPYRDFLKAQTQETLELFPVDGVFFDIVNVKDCSCRYCVAGMKDEGLDPLDPEQRLSYARKLMVGFRLEMARFVRQFNFEATVFFNSGHVGPEVRPCIHAFTHFELESLPGGSWGYRHFPVVARYARTLGADILSHTGRFHTSWGDFHSFKNKAALEYECFRMLALNAKCVIGDQLHPNGKLCRHVYDLIGSVYTEVEKVEPWCRGAKPVTEVAVLSPAEFTGEAVPDAAAGAVRMLEEGAVQFDVVDSQSDFSPYRVLVLPDRIPVDDELARKLEGYFNGGGRVLASFESGLRPEGDTFALEDFGVRLRPNPVTGPDGAPVRGTDLEDPRNSYAEYVLPEEPIGRGLPFTEHVMYAKGVEIEARAGAEVLAKTVASYFNRTWERFCSHRQTPSSGRPDYPAVVRTEHVLYFAHPVFSIYHRRTPLWIKRMVLNGLGLLLPDPILRHDGPSTLLATVNELAGGRRWVLHLLHYIPERRGVELDVIEDVIPLYDLGLSLRTPRSVKLVRTAPQGEEIVFLEQEGRLEFVLPKLEGRQMVELVF